MSPEQEFVLFESLGRIENKIDNCVNTLSTHTVQDGVNFQKLEAQIDDVRDRQIKDVENKITALNLVAAEKKGADEALAKVASSSGGKAGAAVSLVVTGVVTALMAYFGAK